MPLIEIKVLEGEFSPIQTRQLVRTITDAMVGFTGEPLRQATWVVIDEVKSGNWSIGGDALGLENVRALQADSNTGITR
jgi:4-oxalocrotonate tautomerase